MAARKKKKEEVADTNKTVKSVDKKEKTPVKPVAEVKPVTPVKSVAAVAPETPKKVERKPNPVTHRVIPGVTVSEPVKKSKQKFEIGSVVYVAKNVEVDLNGFKLFPQYKKYTYTVEAYDGSVGVYTLRRLNLSLKLKEADIVAPDDRHDNPLMKVQY